MKNPLIQRLVKALLTLSLALFTARFAGAQSLYVADGNVEQVVRYNIQTQAGQGAFTSGYPFSTPIGLAFGSNGALHQRSGQQ